MDSTEQKNIEQLKEKIEEKLNLAEEQRNKKLEKVKNTAQLSAKKKSPKKEDMGSEMKHE